MDNDENKIQRALNEAKRKELEEKYGGMFGAINPDLPPDIEASWLEHIDAFEAKFADAALVPIRTFVGNPDVRPLTEIPAPNVGIELKRLLEILELNDIIIDFGRREVPAEEKYRFITEELFNELIEDVRDSGMLTNFIYEVFHPDEVMESMVAAEDFLTAFLQNNVIGLRSYIGSEGLLLPSGVAVNRIGFEQALVKQRAPLGLVVDSKFSNGRSTVEGRSALVTLDVAIRALRAGSDDIANIVGLCTFQMRRAECGWEVVRAIINLSRY
jgi:hypothetical protein